MEVEKRSSKGGFFQLFDWNVKSRKKLFSNKSELPEGLKKGKENFDSTVTPRLQKMKMHENDPGPTVRGIDYNCASLVSNDEGYGTRAPGVVAKLMGLDTLPTSNFSEPCFTPLFDSRSFRNSHPPMSSTDFQSEHHIIEYDNLRNKLDGFSRNPVELRLQKLQNRPIERFQTEMLPPKSAKSISITHHRLLSPIKNPRFILTKNAAYIMEAAAKIIEQSPQSTIKGKFPSLASSSVPLRIQDLKEKIEAARKTSRLPEAFRRPKEHSSVNYMKGQPSDWNRSGSEDSERFRPSVVPKQGGSGSMKNKGRSVSLAIQAKVNVQRREGLSSSGNRSLMNQKEDNKVNSGHFDKKQRNTQKIMQKRTSTSRTSDVLRQNNQKQNCASNKDKASLKPIVPYQKDRKALSTNGSFRASKSSNKVVEKSAIGTRNTNSAAVETGKELSSSKTKNFSGKKRPVNEDFLLDESDVNDELFNKNERPVKCNVSIDGCTNCDTGDRKNGLDVVSFTFTSPIKKSVPGSQSLSRVMEKNNSLCLGSYDDQADSKTSTLPSLGLNVIGGDDLSVLLEQKLKELTCRIELSNCNLVKEGSSASTLQDLVPSLNVDNTVSTEHDKRFQLGLPMEKPGSRHDSDYYSVDGLLIKGKQKWHGLEEMKGHSSSSNNSKYGKELDRRYPSPFPSLEPCSDGCCNSSDSKTSFTRNSSKQCLSPESNEIVSWKSAEKAQLVEDETEVSDCASSISIGGMERKDISTTFGYANSETSSHWQIEYVNEVLSNVEVMLNDFMLAQAPSVITPDLFDQLENQKMGSDKNMEEYYKLERKVLFDCLRECLEFRCEQLLGGSSKARVKWTTLFRRKECLAEELYKEISDWTIMEDLMVDELVDKDMSTHYGKWVDFEIEEFEEGKEIEEGILNSLVDEMVTDLFLFYSPSNLAFSTRSDCYI